MKLERLTADLHVLRGLVNVYIFELPDGFAIFDTGFPGSADKILAAVKTLGGEPGDVKHIILSHAHPDHIGSAAALKRATGATVWAHPIDRPIIEAGTGFRGGTASPGWRNHLMTRLVRNRYQTVEPTVVDRTLEDGDSPDFLPDLVGIHSPGHCAGQLAFLWARHGGVLFTADTCANRRGLTLTLAAEDHELALASLARLATFDFDKVLVMHGAPIMSDGAVIFRQTKFG